MFIMILIIQPDHKFAYVATAELSRNMQNCDQIWASLFILLHTFNKVSITSSNALYDMGPR